MSKIDKQDLAYARKRLIDGDLALVVVKNGRVLFETQAHGIRGFLKAINILNHDLAESSIADRVVGGAVALLSVYCKVAAVFAVVISKEGVRVLEDNNVLYQFSKWVPTILNRTKDDLCPFEKLALTISTPEEAYHKLVSN